MSNIPVGDLVVKVVVDGDMICHIGNEDVAGVEWVQVAMSPVEEAAEQRERIVAGVREYLKRWDGDA